MGVGSDGLRLRAGTGINCISTGLYYYHQDRAANVDHSFTPQILEANVVRFMAIE